MIRSFINILILSLVTFAASAQSTGPYASSLPEIPAKDVGIYIEDLRTGDVILDVNGEKTFTPASVTKLVTTSTALNRLDPSSSFVTDIMIDGPVENGLLNGNIIIKACGDPTIESSHFPSNKGFARKIAAAAKQRGITTIRGTVKVEYAPTLEQPTPAGWMEEDLIWPYGAEFHAVNYADNVVSVNAASGAITPATPGAKVQKSGRNHRTRGSNILEVSGSQRVANPAPETTMRADVEKELSQAGIEIQGERIASRSKPQLLVSHKSPTIYEIIRSLMYRSDNLMAEGMLRATAPASTRNQATTNELDFWASKGIDTEGIVIEDGSGLSRNNKITPYFLAEVLDWMRLNRNNNGEYVNIFPVAGQSGTMRSFLKGTELEGKLVAKTGSMRNVQCYAGFKIDEKGRPTHLVVMLLNNFSDRNKLKKSLEKLLLKKLL